MQFPKDFQTDLMDQKTDPTYTSQQILDIAQRLVQTRGFNAFSYADIASVLGVSKASLHYHFASKAELGVKLIERYEDGMARALNEIRTHSGEQRRSCGVMWIFMRRYWQMNECAFAACWPQNSGRFRKPCRRRSTVFLRSMSSGLQRL